jgi:5-methylcytosine-specific restriction enzyme subunit McrC
MRRLIRAQDLATESTEGLAQLCRLFSDIEDIELTGRVFGRVQLYRNNQFYDFLLKVCELIYRNLLVSEKSGSSKFMDFVRDKRQMAILFENFVRTFYRIHTDYKVKREDIYWRWIAADQVAAGLLPKMQTDISLTAAARKIIIDCKFTPEATQHHYEAETLRSSHLFQINAYLTNLPVGKLTDTCEMMLLYPTVDSPLSHDFMDGLHRIKIRTINLEQNWQGIHKDLLALVA